MALTCICITFWRSIRSIVIAAVGAVIKTLLLCYVDRISSGATWGKKHQTRYRFSSTEQCFLGRRCNCNKHQVKSCSQIQSCGKLQATTQKLARAKLLHLSTITKNQAPDDFLFPLCCLRIILLIFVLQSYFAPKNESSQAF